MNISRKSLVHCLRFANWCKEFNIEPHDVAELIQLAHRAFKAGERNCNEGTAKSQKADALAGNRFEAKARELGFAVDWPGLWPVLRRKNRDVFLPDI